MAIFGINVMRSWSWQELPAPYLIVVGYIISILLAGAALLGPSRARGAQRGFSVGFGATICLLAYVVCYAFGFR